MGLKDAGREQTGMELQFYLVVSAIVSLLVWMEITGFFGFVSGMTKWLNKCKCLYVDVSECVCEFIVMWECAKWVWLLMSVWMSDGVCNKVDNRDGYKCWKNTLFLTDIYITSRNTLKFTWLLIIHIWGICPVCVSQKLVKSDVLFSIITSHIIFRAYASSTGKISTTNCSLPCVNSIALRYL